ncbi:MAG: asparaginase, partial [Flavobacteriales bacterium]
MNSSQTILLIYTGGTIGMMEDPESGSLIPFDFAQLRNHVPELRRFDCNIEVVSFDEPIDSSDVNIVSWQRMAELVEVNYSHYDGFVILHGTDTMAFSASALSFMLQNVAKPVIFTGSQLPIGQIRTDGKENLITAIEIASATESGSPIIQEVCVLFQSKLFRGNRTHKYSTENFDAFESANLPALVEIGIHIHYRRDLLLRPKGPLTIRKSFDDNVSVLKIFPGISKAYVEGVLSLPGIKAFVLETFGAGNGPTDAWFLDALRNAASRGIILLNITQCNKGMVEQGLYETSVAFEEIGILSGGDMTTEAALVKLMYLL